MPIEDKNKIYLIYLVMGLSIAFAGYMMVSNFQGMLMWDEAEYALSARTFLDGGTYLNKLRPPMMGVLGSISLGLSKAETDFILKLPIPIMAILSCLTLYKLVGKVDSKLAGLIGAVSLAFMPSFWLHTASFLSEIPFILFFLGSILFFYKGLYFNNSAFHFAWIFVGFAFLTRYTALLLGPIFIILTLINLIVSRKSFVDVLKKSTFWISPIWTLLIMAPWLIHQQLIHGDFLVGFKIAMNQLPSYAPEISMPWYYYLSNLPNMVGYPILTIFILGIGLVIYKRDLLGINCLAITAFLLIWFSMYRYKELRLITSILPMIAIVCGICFRLIKQHYYRAIDRNYIIIPFLMFVLYFGYAHNHPTFQNNRTLGYPSLTEAMAWLKAQSAKEDIIMGASSPQIEWYTNRTTMGFPSTYEAFKTKLKETNWVVVVNYERGQARYLSEMIQPEIFQSLIESGKAYLFPSQIGYYTIVIQSSELLQSLNQTIE